LQRYLAFSNDECHKQTFLRFSDVFEIETFLEVEKFWYTMF